jgi:GAF domain-containing protein
MLATQVAVVVRNAHLLETSRRQARQEHLVNEISDRIRRHVDLETILKTTTDELGRALGARKATIRINPQHIGSNAAGASTAAPGLPLSQTPGPANSSFDLDALPPPTEKPVTQAEETAS